MAFAPSASNMKRSRLSKPRIPAEPLIVGVLLSDDSEASGTSSQEDPPEVEAVELDEDIGLVGADADDCIQQQYLQHLQQAAAR
mmetsp:Transcript_70803/g.117618  ORF Transcript_70803/g.117618 Transcript_70803/m.117618 type:complete len:84 (+) Transcript_70803:157-408(+)